MPCWQGTPSLAAFHPTSVQSATPSFPSSSSSSLQFVLLPTTDTSCLTWWRVEIFTAAACGGSSLLGTTRSWYWTPCLWLLHFAVLLLAETAQSLLSCDRCESPLLSAEPFEGHESMTATCSISFASSLWRPLAPVALSRQQATVASPVRLAGDFPFPPSSLLCLAMAVLSLLQGMSESVAARERFTAHAEVPNPSFSAGKRVRCRPAAGALAEAFLSLAIS